MSTPRVDFYILDSTAPGGRYRFACRVAEKAYQQEHRVYIHSENAVESRQLDDLLWSFRDNSFIPHDVQAQRHAEHPLAVIINHAPPDSSENDLLINLTQDTPSFSSQFARIVEIIDQEPSTVQYGRQRYRQYRELGYEMNSHNIG